MADYIGQCFGSYRLLRLLGQGSFADVYLGEHLSLKTKGAVKVPYKPLDREAVELFLTEPRLLQVLKHPHILGIHEIGMADEIPYFVMDYALGGSLRERHPKGQSLPLHTILEYVRLLASALDYAHGHKLIHRDLKPEKLLLGLQGQVLLNYFGMALPMHDAEIISVQSVGGTLAYMAPEQIRGKPKAASDQYGLAIIIYEWLTGRRPFHGGAAELCRQHLFIPPPSFYERVPGCSLLVERVLFKALAKEPDERFSSVADFAEALGQASRGEEPSNLLKPKSLSATAVRERARKSSFLPVQLTSLVGRDDERKAAFVMLVSPEVRLLTLIGPGGIGKTRLSLAIAADLLDVFMDGICFVSLAAISDSDEVLTAIVRASGMKERPDLPLLSALKDFLRYKHLLLLLDNFEQVIDAAPLLMELLHECPDLTMLVTSRSLLYIPGEHTFPLSPLSFPDLKQLPSVEEFIQYPSVELFVQRARQIRSDFQITEDNAPIVAEICMRLDGLPLALELAAARIKVLSPQSLLSRLANRLALLSSPGQTLVAQRQQTMRNAIQWSYDLLTVDEQTLFARLSIFVGGFGLADAEALYGQLGEDASIVLDIFTQLLDKSLIFQVEQQEEPRFQMLETIREFGLECLTRANKIEHIRIVHARYFHSLLPEPAPVEMGLAHGQKLALIKREYGNLRAALRTLQERQEIEEALQLIVAMSGIWIVSGYEREGQEEILKALALAQTLQAPVSLKIRAMAYYVAGRVTMGILQTRQALELFEECIPLARQLSDKRYLLVMLSSPAFAYNDLGNYEAADEFYAEGVGLAQDENYRNNAGRVLLSYGISKFVRGEFKEAGQLFEESLSIARTTRDMWVTASSLHYGGWAYYCQRSYEKAHRMGEEGIELFRQIGFANFGLEALSILAYEKAALGKTEQAQALFEEAFQLSQKVREIQSMALALCGQGYLFLRRSNLTRAKEMFEEGLKTSEKLQPMIAHYRYIPACCMEGLSEIASAQGHSAWATRLLGAAQEIRVIGTYCSSIGRDQAIYDRIQKAVRTKLGEISFTRALKEGRAMTLQKVVVALGEEKALDNEVAQKEILAKVVGGNISISSNSGTSSSRPGVIENLPGGGKLTKREMDVLHLLAEGHTNAEIAEKLVLSIVTVNSYLRSIYSKLGVSSRMRAVRYAREQHIL